MKITEASHLTGAQRLAELIQLAGSERQATVALIVHLAEFDRRRLYEAEGFSTAFAYCREVLRLSEAAAYNRLEAARAARRFPEVLEMLASGALSPTTARLLARHLTEENHRALLAAAAGMSKRDVEVLLGRMFPQEQTRGTVRPLTARASASAAPAAPVLAQASPHPPVEMSALPSVQLDREETASVPPLAPERYAIHCVIGVETYQKLQAARNLMAHTVPSGDVAQVLDRALTVLLKELRRAKCALTDRPRAQSTTKAPPSAPVPERESVRPSRYVPAEVRRAVWKRDDARCAFVARGGRRCDARRWLEFHHVRPAAVGGAPTIGNIQLRCRAHNGHEVDLFFGPGRRRIRDDTATAGP